MWRNTYLSRLDTLCHCSDERRAFATPVVGQREVDIDPWTFAEVAHLLVHQLAEGRMLLVHSSVDAHSYTHVVFFGIVGFDFANHGGDAWQHKRTWSETGSGRKNHMNITLPRAYCTNSFLTRLRAQWVLTFKRISRDISRLALEWSCVSTKAFFR